MAQSIQTELIYQKLNGGPNLIANFSKTNYRSAKIVIQASSNLSHQLSEMYVIHDGNTAFTSTSNLVNTSSVFTTFTANTDANLVYVYATSSEPNTDLAIFVTNYKNPVEPAEETLYLDSVTQVASLMGAFYPDANTNYADALTSSLNKEKELTELNIRFNKGLEYMQTAEFLAKPTSQQAHYINSLANSINSLSQTLDDAVTSDIENYRQFSRNVDSMALVTDLNSKYANPHSKAILDKVLKRETKVIFAANKP